jgi:hypothetical protein
MNIKVADRASARLPGVIAKCPIGITLTTADKPLDIPGEALDHISRRAMTLPSPIESG